MCKTTIAIKTHLDPDFVVSCTYFNKILFCFANMKVRFWQYGVANGWVDFWFDFRQYDIWTDGKFGLKFNN